MHDIQRGNIELDENKTFKEYIVQYQANAQSYKIKKLVEQLGVDETKLQELMQSQVSEKNLNDYGRFDELKATVDKSKAKVYFEGLEGIELSSFKVNTRVHKLLKEFIVD